MTRHAAMLSVLAAIFAAQGVVANAEPRVGVILPMTGEFARYGDMIRSGLEGELQGRASLLYEDEGCIFPKTAVSAFQKLRSVDGVRLFLGPWCGSPQVAVASLIKKSGELAILGSSAPERVFELSSGNMLAVQHSIEAESRFNADKAFELGARRVVILFLESDFGRAHEAAFRQRFKGEILETLTFSSPDAASLKPLLLRLRALAPDTLYVPDATPFFMGLSKELHQNGLKDLRVMSVYSAQSEDILKAVGEAGEGLLYSYPSIEGEALVHFPRLAVKVLLAGLESCPGGEPQCVKAAIQKRFSFDSHGVLSGDLALKTIQRGRFVWY